MCHSIQRWICSRIGAKSYTKDDPLDRCRVRLGRIMKGQSNENKRL
jgi:hypothetical protein